MLKCARVVTAVVVCSSFCFVAQAETVWWDWEYNGDLPLNQAHPALWLKDHPNTSYVEDAGLVTCIGDRKCRRPTSTTDEWADVVDCPSCIGGKYLAHKSDSKWDGVVILPGDKTQGYWPSAASEGCPGNADASPFPHWTEAGWYVPGTGLGNPGCFAGGATIEVRYRWHGDLNNGPYSSSAPNKVGLMPFAYPSMQYQALLAHRSDIGDYIEFATWGDRPHVDIGDDWVVVRMIMGSSWDGLDYFVHDDGSLEVGTSDDRGAAWTATGNQFSRNEFEKVVTFANPYPNAAPQQNDKGWKGFETAGREFFAIGSGADMDLDYIRWAFDQKVYPVPEPAAGMVLLGLSSTLLLRRRQRRSS